MFLFAGVIFSGLLFGAQGFAAWDHHSSAGNLDDQLDCRPPYGCFPVGPPWMSNERPVSLAPLSLDAIKPRFRLFTPSHQGGVTIDEQNVTALIDLPLSPDLRLIFIAHGFIESGDTGWVRSMVKTLLKTQSTSGSTRFNRLDPSGKIAVVVVDWRDGALPPYAQAVANIRLVGAVTGHIVVLLQEVFQLSGSSFHLVGHSLGSHLMGYAGSFVSQHNGGRGLVGRITALDPAGPYFRNADPLVRLDPTDAQFVDVLHTDNNEIVPGIPVSLGNPDAVGHVDFYPNGGGLQPGCSGSLGEEMLVYNKNFAHGFLGFMGCHHQRSVHYFLESIAHSRCSFLAVECPSWEEFQQGQCWDCSKSSCSRMGFYSTPEQGKFEKNIIFPAASSPVASHEAMQSDTSDEIGIKVAIESFIAVVRETFDEVIKQAVNVTNEASLDPINDVELSNVNKSDVKTLHHFLDHMVDLAQNMSHLRQKRENSEANVSKKMFLVTRNSYPYCERYLKVAYILQGTQLRVTVLASSGAEASRHGGDVARFSIKLRGSTSAAHVSIPSQGAMYLGPGDSSSIVTAAAEDLKVLHELEVTFVQPDDLLRYLLWRFETPVVYVDSFVVEDLVSGRVTRFPADPQEFRLGAARVLRPAGDDRDRDFALAYAMRSSSLAD